jgi:hypothetical protein
MNEQALSQIVIGALTIAASRDAAVRAEVLRVGDPVRVLTKPSYGEPKVHTGVIVAFEPFRDQPTVVVAYIESEFSKAELKIVAFNDKTKEIEIIAAPENVNIGIERSRVLDWFNQEERKKLAEIDEIKAKREYFDRYFGRYFTQIEGEAKSIEAVQ